ncbi:thioredoxin family protein [Oleiagrimonas sp. C23AA]|uniref:thioredoxin family protein n=1 Tax=Oleiagrimonas sp. C23AA TaxID=2719047 RepID=UPI00142320A5|nr:thioredoxin family protein [Oleiagrimonas sp. C23AA]NII11958.1 thioredoxin family protein [Oleiagrimonas sp. C23AA]
MKRLLLIAALLLAAAPVLAKDMPYNTKADAKAEVAHALSEAKVNHKPVLLFFGANWCPDCRALAKSVKHGKNAKLLARHFNIVKIDVGQFDHNTNIAKRFGNPIKGGIPAAVIVSPQGKVMFSTKAGQLANARHMSDQGVYGFFEKAIKDSHAG